jgi:ribosomal protein S18 acetylase RimI-like enzyme
MSMWRKVAGRLVRPPRFEHRLVMYRDLDGTLPSFSARTPFEVEELGPDAAHVEHVLSVIPAEHRNGAAQRIVSGDRCWVARCSGEVVYEAWVGYGSTYSYTLDRRLPLEPTDMTVYGAYTVPAMRNRGIHGAAVSHILAAERTRGMRRIFILMEPDNPAALRMPEKLGFHTVGSTGFLEVFGLRFYFLRDQGVCSRVQPRQYWRKV